MKGERSPVIFKVAKRRRVIPDQPHSRAWNDRFSVTYSKDNEKYHTFYKEFFGKQVKQKPEQVTFVPKPQDPETIEKLK